MDRGNGTNACGSDAFDTFLIKWKLSVLKTYEFGRSPRWNRAVNAVVSVSS